MKSLFLVAFVAFLALVAASSAQDVEISAALEGFVFVVFRRLNSWPIFALIAASFVLSPFLSISNMSYTSLFQSLGC